MPNIKKDGTFSKRHRGASTPNHPAPYELSLSRIENFLKCKALFWLKQVKGVKPPKMPGFTINTTTDVLLKRVVDEAFASTIMLHSSRYNAYGEAVAPIPLRTSEAKDISALLKVPRSAENSS